MDFKSNRSITIMHVISPQMHSIDNCYKNLERDWEDQGGLSLNF